MTAYWAEHAWLPDGPAERVRLEIADGTFSSVRRDADSDGAEVLPGIVLPGFADAHSHVFHRALRGRTHAVAGDFLSWRQQMYEVAGRLDPDSLLDLATAGYAELALAGVTCVGEFHYLHHQTDGRPYADPNVMAAALREAARRAGIRLTVLDACYLTGGMGVPVEGAQRRFADASAGAWAERVAALDGDATTRVGVAAHSVRAVPPEDLLVVTAVAGGRPLHVHVAEQPAEVAECLAAHGRTPVELLDEAGCLGPTTTVVHATRVGDADVRRLGAAGVSACLCPTTERDLGDGLPPTGNLRAADVRLCVGSDQHAVVDLLEEARSVELHERLRTGRRACLRPGELVDALTANGHAALGWPQAGRLEAGAPADLVAVRLDSVRTAGSDPGQVVMTAAAADVDTVVVGGRQVVRDGAHGLGDVAPLLARAVGALR